MYIYFRRELVHILMGAGKSLAWRQAADSGKPGVYLQSRQRYRDQELKSQEES